MKNTKNRDTAGQIN